jgi:hypothetical protein
VAGFYAATRPHSAAAPWPTIAPPRTAGVGVGANVLVGGTQKSISLQPLSVEGHVGVNLALGVAGMTLHPVR